MAFFRFFFFLLMFGDSTSQQISAQPAVSWMHWPQFL